MDTFVTAVVTAGILVGLISGCSPTASPEQPLVRNQEDVRVSSPFLPTDNHPAPENESARFRAGLIGCLIQHDGFALRPKDAVHAEYSSSLLGTGERERVFGLHLPFLRAYSGDTVRILQTALLKEFPGWTLIIAPGCSSTDELFVTADRVVYENRVIDDVNEFMAQLRLEEERGRDNTRGAEMRQLAWLRPRIPSLAATMNAGAPYAIAGTFDNTYGNRDRIAIWLLSTSHFDEVYVMPVGGPPSRGGLTRPVDAQGLVYDRRYTVVNGEKESIETPYWLDCWIIPADYTGDTLLVVNELNNTTDEIPFDPTLIIRDVDLPRFPLP